MLKDTQIILNIAAQRKLADKAGRSLSWYVYDQYGKELGFSSTDSLSLEVRAELETLGLFDWRK